MNKSELIEIVCRKTKLSKNKVSEVFRETKNLMIEVLNKGGKIELRDFGRFETKETSDRLYRNPITKRLFYSNKKKQIRIKLFKNFKYMIG